MEPDQRDVDLIIKDLDLESANEVITPWEKDPKGKAVEQDVELGPEDTTRYRAIVARANYLAADRLDLMYSTKAVCRGVAKPTKQDWHKIKRLGRCLVGSGRTVMKRDWQGHA